MRDYLAARNRLPECKRRLRAAEVKSRKPESSLYQHLIAAAFNSFPVALDSRPIKQLNRDRIRYTATT